MPSSKRLTRSPSSSSSSTTTKQAREQHVPLIPGLPDHLSHLCLSPLPPPLLFSVSRTWRRFLYSPSCPPFPALYALLAPAAATDVGAAVELSFFDPVSSEWTLLPGPPLPPLLLSHPSFISRRLPLQSLSSAPTSHLLLLSATSPSLSPALPRPLFFHPPSSSWSSLPSIPSSPRRWCALASSSGSLYIASGIASQYNSDVARSFHRFNLNNVGAGWESLAPLKDGRFSREPIEMVASEGKLCMVNSAQEGAVYDIGSDRWVEMPAGMLAGWTGPAAEVERRIHVVDGRTGVVKRYEWDGDAWTLVMESEALRGAVAVAAGGGRMLVTCRGGDEEEEGEVIRVVDLGGKRVWTVKAPEGRRVVAVHVLPRMTR